MLDDAGMPWWSRDAACLGVPTADHDPWFSGDPAEALEVCGRCPSRLPCADYALSAGIVEGVWGGLTEEARAKARQDDRAA